MGAGPLPCGDPVACGSSVSDRLMMTLLPLRAGTQPHRQLHVLDSVFPLWPEVGRGSWGEPRITTHG